MVPIYAQDVVALSTGTATRAAPTLATEGLRLADVRGVRVTVSADSGQTLSGAGTLRAYWYSWALLRWIRDPDLDMAVTPSGFSWVNVRDRVFPDLDTSGMQVGRIFFACDAVAAGGGTNVTVTLEGGQG